MPQAFSFCARHNVLVQHPGEIDYRDSVDGISRPVCNQGHRMAISRTPVGRHSMRSKARDEAAGNAARQPVADLGRTIRVVLAVLVVVALAALAVALAILVVALAILVVALAALVGEIKGRDIATKSVKTEFPCQDAGIGILHNGYAICSLAEVRLRQGLNL